MSRATKRVRYLVAAAFLLLVMGGLAGAKFAQISKLIRFGEEATAGPPPEAVGTAISKRGTWEIVIDAVGSVAAARGVTISNEVPGVVRAIHFESGASVRPGQALLELDADVELAQLASLKARLELARANAARTRRLTEGGALAQARLDADEAELKTTAAEVKALEERIGQKTVRAPFAGRLGIREVNLGQYLNPGTPISSLESLDAVYVDFTVPQQELARLAVGMPARFVLPDTQPPETKEGKISAIDPAVDPDTRSVKLRASVKDEEDRLRPGMFVTVAVVLPERAEVIFVPATAVVRAPYGNSVYKVVDRKDQAGRAIQGPDGKPVKVARQQFVHLGVTRGDFVAITEGVTEGQEVVSVGAFKLRNDTPVVVNNEIRLKPSIDPRPENR